MIEMIQRLKKNNLKCAVIKHLIESDKEGEISWNFEKFLVNQEGKLVKRFKSSVKPTSKELTSEIDNLFKK